MIVFVTLLIGIIDFNTSKNLHDPSTKYPIISFIFYFRIVNLYKFNVKVKRIL